MYAIFTNSQEIIKLARSNGDQVTKLNAILDDGILPTALDAHTEMLISDFLTKTLCIPVHYTGYKYLKTIFEMSILQEGFERKPLIAFVYNDCGKQHGCTLYQVERSIRYAIHTAYEKRDKDKYFEVFNTSAPCENGQFIRASINYFKNHVMI